MFCASTFHVHYNCQFLFQSHKNSGSSSLFKFVTLYTDKSMTGNRATPCILPLKLRLRGWGRGGVYN